MRVIIARNKLYVKALAAFNRSFPVAALQVWIPKCQRPNTTRNTRIILIIAVSRLLSMLVVHEQQRLDQQLFGPWLYAGR